MKRQIGPSIQKAICGRHPDAVVLLKVTPPKNAKNGDYPFGFATLITVANGRSMKVPDYQTHTHTTPFWLDRSHLCFDPVKANCLPRKSDQQRHPRQPITAAGHSKNHFDEPSSGRFGKCVGRRKDLQCQNDRAITE